MSRKEFSLGQKVRVAQNFYDSELRGMFGVVAMPPETILNEEFWEKHVKKSRSDLRDRVYWIEFASSETVGSVDGAEIEEEFLECLQT